MSLFNEKNIEVGLNVELTGVGKQSGSGPAETENSGSVFKLTTDHRPLTTVLVPRARLELARLSTPDPKSSASANFATSA